MPEIRQTDPAAPEALQLTAALDDDLSQRYPGISIQGIDAEEFRAVGGYFIVAWLDNQPVACGAFRPLDATSAELKRVFVPEAWRGRGIAHVVVAHLENAARSSGFSTLRLETGTRQPEALALYRKRGYIDIPAFGTYIDGPFSIFLEKFLRPEAS